MKTTPLELTAQIVGAFLTRTSLDQVAIGRLVRDVSQALVDLQVGPVPEKRLEPAVPIKRSIFPDYIVCLEDGRKLKMLKRYLRVKHGMTVDQYRARWGLPHDYPSVAPNYSIKRSGLAKAAKLGQKAD